MDTKCDIVTFLTFVNFEATLSLGFLVVFIILCYTCMMTVGFMAVGLTYVRLMAVD